MAEKTPTVKSAGVNNGPLDQYVENECGPFKAVDGSIDPQVYQAWRTEQDEAVIRRVQEGQQA